MTDLIKWLRHCSSNTKDEVLKELTRRAADRIERVEKERDDIAQLCDPAGIINENTLLKDQAQQLGVRVASLRKERDHYAELAAGECVTQKVLDELGRQTLTSLDNYQTLLAAKKKLGQIARGEIVCSCPLNSFQTSVNCPLHGGVSDE